MDKQKPSIGRIVHFCSEEGGCRAAIITGLSSMEPEEYGSVNLIVFEDNPDEGEEKLFTGSSISHDEDKGAVTWHWPERV